MKEGYWVARQKAVVRAGCTATAFLHATSSPTSEVNEVLWKKYRSHVIEPYK